MAKMLFHALVGSENSTRACFPFLQAVANKERGGDEPLCWSKPGHEKYPRVSSL